jgi:uncharacterized protein (TIGR00369 family)
VAPVSDVDEKQTAFVREAMPFATLLGVEVLSSAKEEVHVRLAWRADLCTVGGVLHGGVLMSLADSAGAACAMLNLPPGAAGTTTIESKTNFMRAVTRGHLHARSRPLHAGRTTVVVTTELRDDDDRLVGVVTQTQAVLGAP